MDFQEKNPRSKIRWKNLWNIFFLIFNAFFCLILYHPGFYSSLSDKKQRNGGSSNIPTRLVKFAKNGGKIIFSSFLTNLPISQTFLKCCHFLVFYRSVSCKSQDDRELNRKKASNIKKHIFNRFFNLLCFADFFLENPWNVTKSMGYCKKTAN